jgi:cyclopropane fatty-acyl-phospholipid synthase-like methyltransferase
VKGVIGAGELVARLVREYDAALAGLTARQRERIAA